VLKTCLKHFAREIIYAISCLKDVLSTKSKETNDFVLKTCLKHAGGDVLSTKSFVSFDFVLKTSSETISCLKHAGRHVLSTKSFVSFDFVLKTSLKQISCLKHADRHVLSTKSFVSFDFVLKTFSEGDSLPPLIRGSRGANCLPSDKNRRLPKVGRRQNPKVASGSDVLSTKSFVLNDFVLKTSLPALLR